ncbi:TetR/AcrR family transcriptional regulator [Nocardia uniformis]|uniref:TetR/AcrR family transcriptional regulator n=1 Tax=Nocardia uniformis TaxID=53432 RepID=A0A849CGQ6_9NOCA|nr:TetR/AcrR family transcriptional regulator [Nocardia uniformis]NNH72681.1 TetR/AcrR family transcriptional regulator [Nocardia uniformis]
MSAGPRDRLIESAIELVREQGVHGTGLAALLDRSRASRNSLYQHFPAGKGELVEEATRVAGERMTAVLARITAVGSARQWLEHLINWWRKNLETTSFTAGCPVVSAALAESEPRVQAAAAHAFEEWTELVANALSRDGIPADRARSLAGSLLSAIQGAVIQARALKSTRPLADVRDQLAVLLTEQPATTSRE